MITGLKLWPLGVGFTLCLLLAPDSPAQQAAPTPQRLAGLVDQLGDSSFGVREQAYEELIKIGLPAIDAITKGLTSRDREIRYRCLRLSAIIRERDFQRRLKAFAESRDPDADFDLPAWDEYRTLAGDGEHVRALFVQMQKEQSRLLAVLATDPREVGKSLQEEILVLQSQLQTSRRQLTLGAVTALLLVAGSDGVELLAQDATAISSFCYQNCVSQEMVSGGRHQQTVKKLLGRWIARSHDSANYQGIVLATRYNLPEGLIPARRTLKQGGQPAHVVLYALVAFAKLGDRADTELLESMLDNKTQVTVHRVRNGKKFENVPVEARDLALAALLHLHGQDLKEFGFIHIQPNAQMVFNTNSARFDNDDLRQQALAKWRGFRSTQPRPKR